MTLDDFSVRRPSFQADLKKMIVTGSGDFIVEKIKIDLDNPQFDIQVNVPRVEARGFYENTFNLGWLNTRAKGRIVNQLADVKMRFSFKGHIEVRNGQKYAKFDTFNVAAKISKIKIYLENAFPDKALNDAVNGFINQNTDLFLPEVEASIRQTLGKNKSNTSVTLSSVQYNLSFFFTCINQEEECVQLYSKFSTTIL